jgi:hypothetical protein
VARKTEGKLQDAIIRRLKARMAAGDRLYYHKITVTQYSQAGTPDLMICYYGRALNLEVKPEGERPTALQVHEMKKWSRAGSVSQVVYSVEEVDEILDSLPRLLPFVRDV